MSAFEAAVESVSRSAFVGRGEELGRLHAALRRAADGRPGMVVVAGEAGVGKSRLIEEFADQAGQAGAVVAVGGAAPLAGGALPYAPLVQALRALAEDRRVASSEAERGELVRAVAWLTADSPDGRGTYAPEVGRGRLFDLLAGLLGRLGRDVPLVLVLEDLHWADSATLDVLAFLLRTLRRARLLVVGSYRVDEPGERLPGWLAEVRRLRTVGWVELARFTRAELAALLVGLRGGPVDAAVVAEIFDRSEGNPFFAEELVAAGTGAGPARLPRSRRVVLLARVHRLSPAGQRLLAVAAVAAVAGRWVCLHLLAAMVGGAVEELTDALREMVGGGVLLVRSTDPAGQEVYVFRHALLQEAVYGELLAGERARLHEGCARALTVVSADRQGAGPQFPGELAEHWYRAGRPAEALDWAVRAADRAEQVYAHAEAAQYGERVLELWEQVPDALARAGTDRVGLHTRVARAWEYAGDEARALGHVEEALRRVDPTVDPVRAGLLHKLRAWCHAGMADLDTVLAANREAVRLVPAEPPSTARAQVLWAYGRALHIQAGRCDEALEVCEQALTAARRAGSQPDIARATASVGFLRAVAGQVDAGIPLLREACAATERSADDAWGLAMAHTLLSDALLKTNRLEEAAEVAPRAGTTLRHLGLSQHRYAATLLGNAIEALFGLGRWEEAVRISEPVADQPVSFANVIVQANLAELEGARGQLDAALARLDQVRELRWQLGPERARELGQRRAEVLLWLGRPQPALTDVMQALDALVGTDQERFAGWLACLGRRALADLAEAARAGQDPAATAAVERAGRLLTERVTGMTHDPFAIGALRATAPAEQALWAAEGRRCAGVPDPAGWQTTAAAWHQLGRPYPAAYARWRQAEALLAAGAGAGPAGDPLRAAHTTALRLGAGPLRTQTEALAARARIRLTPPADQPTPAPAAPHGLTDRELAVLRLLTTGHTNREIGQRLFISPKTASVHVTNILRKLTARDRVQAATIAARLGLTDPDPPPDDFAGPPDARASATPR